MSSMTVLEHLICPVFHDSSLIKPILIQLLYTMVITVEACPVLKPPDNGTLSTALHVYGTVVTASCKHGYMFEDKQTMYVVTCLGIAGWSADITDCIGK